MHYYGEASMLRSFKALLLIVALFSGCQRQPRQVLEDSKTAGNHVGRAFASLGGKGRRSRQVESRQAFGLPESAFDDNADGMISEEVSPFEMSENLSDQTYRQASPNSGDQDSSIPGIDAFSVPTGEMAHIIKSIYFDTDQDRPRELKDRDRLVKIALFLKEHPKVYVFIEGHCDERGTAAYNLALGSRRSNSVRKRLIDLGVSNQQLFSISYGKERPAAGGHGEASWRENRRAQFKVLKRS